MASGWVRLHRSLMENDLWKSEPFTRGQAWVDLILLANHKPVTLIKRGITVVIGRGEVGWSEEALAKRWLWSRGKLRRYLKQLETVQQIVHQKNHTLSRIIIINYSKYQENGTTDGTTDSTNNKNDKNDKEIIATNVAESDMSWNKKSDNDDDLPVIGDDGEVQKEQKVKRNYRVVFDVFKKVNGSYPANWAINKTQQLSAENLYTERGLEQIEKALRFYNENKEHEFCPKITSPYDLDSKWSKLFSFKSKL